MSSFTHVVWSATVLALAWVAPGYALPDGRVALAGADVGRLHAEIVREAEALCRADYVPRIHSQRDLQQCVSETTADAVMRSRREDLIAFHAQQAGEEPPATVAALR